MTFTKGVLAVQVRLQETLNCQGLFLSTYEVVQVAALVTAPGEAGKALQAVLKRQEHRLRLGFMDVEEIQPTIQNSLVAWR